MRQMNNVARVQTTLFKMFEGEFELVDVIRSIATERPWSAGVYVVKDSLQGRNYVYKTRQIFPQELVEIESMLLKLIDDPVQHFCRLVDFKLFNHSIHLLLDHVEGTSLDHSHDNYWNNDPTFSKYLSSLPSGIKVKIACQLLESLDKLHRNNLIFQDLKTEQLIITPSYDLVIVDIDTIVLKGGLCASQVIWASPVCPPPSQSCCEYNDIYQAGCIIHELFTAKHLTTEEKISFDMIDIDKIVRKMTNNSLEKGYTTAKEVLDDLTQINI